MRSILVFACAAIVAGLAAPALAQSGGAPAKAPDPGAAAKPDVKAATPDVKAATPFDPAIARRVTVDDVKKWLDEGTKIRIIDTRSAFTGAMVKGAEIVPDAKLTEWAKDLAKDTLIVAYCT